MNALVTGGAGFIGSNLVDRLLADGHVVTVVDDFSTGHARNLATENVRLDVCDADIRSHELASIVRASGAEVVFHLAAQADVRVSVARPTFDADVNILGSLNVLEACRAAGVRKIVFASSGGTIYGEVHPSELPIKEMHPQRPESPYGVTKKVVGDYLHAYRLLHGIEYTALALGNVYGPRQDPHGEAGVVAIFAGRLLAGEPCTIFGDGEQTRDFVYVSDAVDAFVRAASRGDGVLMNISTGRRVSVNALYRALAKAAGVTAEAKYAPPRAGELEHSSLDATLARKLLGWRATTSLEDGARAVVDWYRDRAGEALAV